MAAIVLASTENMSYEDWLENRRQGIGGSDASVVCGINRYKSPLELWMEKTDQLPQQGAGEAAYWGTQLEALVPYLFQGGPLYGQLYGFSNAWYIDHDSYEFQDFEMGRFILYDDSHFSCDVEFNYIIRMGSKVYEYPSAYTLYFVNSAQGWQAAALEIR